MTYGQGLWLLPDGGPASLHPAHFRGHLLLRVHDLEDACAAGIIDDIYGADFSNGGKDGNIQDQNGHGTFVAGVVGAVSNNALGVVGINQVRL